MARVNPYTRLRDRFAAYIEQVRYPEEREMWRYEKASLEAGDGWNMRNLRERVATASQLGYDVVLVAQDGDLIVRYRKRPPIEYAG